MSGIVEGEIGQIATFSRKKPANYPGGIVDVMEVAGKPGRGFWWSRPVKPNLRLQHRSTSAEFPLRNQEDIAYQAGFFISVRGIFTDGVDEFDMPSLRINALDGSSPLREPNPTISSPNHVPGDGQMVSHNLVASLLAVHMLFYSFKVYRLNGKKAEALAKFSETPIFIVYIIDVSARRLRDSL